MNFLNAQKNASEIYIGKIAAKVDTRIQPEYKPDIAFIKLILKQQKGPDVILKLNDIDMWDKPEFEWSKPLVLFISGWTTTPDSWVNTAMYEAYKANGGFNFMVNHEFSK